MSVCKADTVQAAPVQGEEEREAPGAAAPTLVPLAAITSDSRLSCYINSGVFAQALESRSWISVPYVPLPPNVTLGKLFFLTSTHLYNRAHNVPSGLL